MKITFPSGAWADLLPPDQMRSRHIRMMTRSVSGFDEQRIGSRLVDMTDGAAAILVQDWSCVGGDGEVLPLPSADLGSLEDMDVGDYLMLINHDFVAEVQKKFTELMTQRVSPDDFADPDSPTEPSAASGPGSRAAKSLPAKTAGRAGTKPKATSGSPSAGAGRRSK